MIGPTKLDEGHAKPIAIYTLHSGGSSSASRLRWWEAWLTEPDFPGILDYFGLFVIGSVSEQDATARPWMDALLVAM